MARVAIERPDGSQETHSLSPVWLQGVHRQLRLQKLTPMEFEKRHPGMLTALHKQWPDAWNPDAFDRYWTRMKLRTGLQWPWQMGNAQEVDDCYAEAMRALGKPRQGLWQSVKMRGLDYTEYKRRWAQENE